MNKKKLYPLYLSALALCAVSASAQSTTTTTTTTTAPAAPAAAAAPAAPAAAPTSPVSTPSMEGPLTVNVKPESFAIPDFGTIYVSGAVTAIALADTPKFYGEKDAISDISNAQVFVQKVDGVFQFFGEFGGYSLPDLGAAYIRSGDVPNDFWGILPQGYVKLQPSAAFSLEAGKLPTLIGAEYTFSFENMNVQRGLLWNQENAVNRGIQANYTAGPVALSAAWSDGFYSKKYNWGLLSAAWTIDSNNTVAIVGGGSFGTTNVASTLATPIFLANEKIYNVIYTRLMGAWTIEPYYQYTEVPQINSIGAYHSASTSGAALFVNYTFDGKSALAGFSLPARVEYIASTGSASQGSPNLLYGVGSKAWSITLTPTFQYNLFFIRLEGSFVGASSTTPGSVFGPDGNKTTQARLVLETGILF